MYDLVLRFVEGFLVCTPLAALFYYTGFSVFGLLDYWHRGFI
jgi:hypothetical protein